MRNDNGIVCLNIKLYGCVTSPPKGVSRLAMKQLVSPQVQPRAAMAGGRVGGIFGLVMVLILLGIAAVSICIFARNRRYVRNDDKDCSFTTVVIY